MINYIDSLLPKHFTATPPSGLIRNVKFGHHEVTYTPTAAPDSRETNSHTGHSESLAG